ncbi:hypothetical protein H0E87_003306 [Populus deltoides]|uniref:J domain-containing protein n=1 Tax=Populus deltoides TaxID=3696 RepID=A0A8T2ZZ49_POPDE|nr:hypothetical protein H0E87_003306 [Populus deltoides]
MAQQYHPDVCTPSEREESTKRFVELQEAYETLSDPVSRRMHDYEMGLVNSGGFAFEGLPLEDRKNRFPREVYGKGNCMDCSNDHMPEWRGGTINTCKVR